MYDLIVLGGSVAGVTSAIYAVRRKLNILLITPELGGEIATTTEIENWPAENKISGWEFTQKMESQLKYNNVPLLLGQKVIKIEPQENFFTIQTKDLADKEYTYETETVIVATGVHPRHLGVPGEEEFFHKGVTYCATCDAPLFKNKVVAVVGGGNSALTSALMLGELATEVYLLNVNPELRGEAVLIEKVKANSKIKILTEVTTQKIIGEKSVSALEYKDKNSETITLPIQGIFVHIGLSPNADFIDCVEKNKFGEIMVDRAGRTNTPGIFAAGDVTDVPYKQIVIAAGMGSLATLTAIDYLNKK